MTSDPMDAEKDRLDLSALDPASDPARFEQMVAAIRRAASPELARRRGRTGLWGQLASWRRPVLVTSGAFALASAVVLVLLGHAPTKRTGLAEALGVPAECAQWMQSSTRPTPGDLLGMERGQK